MTDKFAKWRFIHIDSDVWHRYQVYTYEQATINFLLIRQNKLLCEISMN